MNIEDILTTEFQAIKDDLVKRHDELDMRASGKWANSLEMKTNIKNNRAIATIYGEHYTEQLVFGREPGKYPPISAIEKWIVDKGISPIEQNMKISTLAFLIARKIAEEGTEYYKKGGTDLISSVVTPERIQMIIDKVSTVNVTAFTSGLVNKIKEVA